MKIDHEELPPCIGERMRDGLQSIYHHGTDEGPTMTLTDQIRQLLKQSPKMLDVPTIRLQMPAGITEDTVFHACQRLVGSGLLTSLIVEGQRVYGEPQFARRPGSTPAIEKPVGPVPRRLPQPGLTGADAEQAVLEAFVPGEAPIAVGELVTRLAGKVSKPMVVQKLQRLRLAGKIVKHGGYNDATWALVPEAAAVQKAPVTVAAAAAPTAAPATEQPPATEPPLHLVLTQMVRAARALTDDSLRRALQLPVSLPVAQQLQAAASALHQVSETLLTSDPA